MPLGQYGALQCAPKPCACPLRMRDRRRVTSRWRRRRLSLHASSSGGDWRSHYTAEAESGHKTFEMRKQELKNDAEERMQSILASAQERVKSHDSASASTANDVPTASIRAAIDHVSTGLVERDTEARLLILAALAGEQILFLGPPGTAKSELARRLNSCLSGSRYFERLLTRFSVPEELFGPLSMRALEQDTYLRNTNGYLPSAEVAFIDEVFKANSAILNTLLTLLNERLFDNGNERTPVPLVCLVAASNELPESEELDALYDRFLIRCNVRQVTAGALAELLTATGAAAGDPAQLPAAAASAEPLTIDAVRRVRAGALENVRVPQHVIDLLVDLRTFLQDALEPPTYVSDRRMVKAVQLMKVAAYSAGRTAVNEYDTLLMRYVLWTRPEDQAQVYDWLLARLAVAGDLKQSNYLLASLFGRTCHALDSPDKLRKIQEEISTLKDVLVDRLESGVAALEGGFSSVTGHLWFSEDEGAALATALQPKLHKAQESVSTTLFELVTLELAIERDVDAVVLANLMPRYWADFIRSSSDKEAREMGTVPTA